MNKKDLLFLGILLILIVPFVISDTIYTVYQDFNSAHGIIMSFIKFALLATLGESLGLRIRSGKYNYSGFGLLPRAIVWGFLGISVKIAFIIFASGTPVLLEYIGLDHASQIITGSVSPVKILIAFSISATLNIFYAPVLMTTHKITDTHIINTVSTSSTAPESMYAPACPSITPRSARSRTISSAKNGFPAARRTTRSTRPASDGSPPTNSSVNAVVCTSLNGRNAIVCALGTRLNTPRYSGR